MDPLLTALTLPVSGPLSALTWIARQIAQAAEQQMLDPGRIETALRQLERQLEAGTIDETAYEAREAELLEELAEITALRAEAARARGIDAASDAASDAATGADT